MIHGHLSSPDAFQHLLVHPAWRLAFDWLRQLPSRPEHGVRQLAGDDLYVHVQAYDTLPVEQCRYESHRRYVDLQYCLGGGEFIDWQLASTLRPDGAFDEARDLQFYQPGDSLTALQMVPGSFAIFYPSDAHRPKRADGRNPATEKAVLKVALRWLESAAGA